MSVVLIQFDLNLMFLTGQNHNIDKSHDPEIIQLFLSV